MLPLLLKEMFAPLPVPASFCEGVSPRDVGTTRADPRGESGRRGHDSGRHGNAAPLSGINNASRYHGGHEGSCRRRRQPGRPASHGHSAQHPPVGSGRWTHGSLRGSRGGRGSDRGSRQTSDATCSASVCRIAGEQRDALVGRERSEVADHLADNGGDSTSANGTFLTCNVPAARLLLGEERTSVRTSSGLRS